MASFDKRVKQIASAEKDVDKVLKAARLKRTENGETTGQIVYKIILTICVTAICIAGIAEYGFPFFPIFACFGMMMIILISAINGGV